jgi:hypothetical protein
MTDPRHRGLRRRARRVRGRLRDGPRDQLAYTAITLGFAILVLGLVAFSLNH